MIEIPEVWSECEISALSKRTREMVITVLTEAGFGVEIVDESTVKVIPRQGSDVPCFRRTLETVNFADKDDNIRFVSPDRSEVR